MGERDEVMYRLAWSLRMAMEDPHSNFAPEVEQAIQDAVVRYLEWQRRDNRLEAGPVDE